MEKSGRDEKCRRRVPGIRHMRRHGKERRPPGKGNVGCGFWSGIGGGRRRGDMTVLLNISNLRVNPMRRIRQPLFALIMLAVFIGAPAVRTADSRAAPAEFRLLIDGKPAELAHAPRMIDGRPAVPMRELFERLGARVDWIGRKRIVTAVKDDTLVVVKVGSDVAVKNGEAWAMEFPALLSRGTTWVPLSFVGEALGVEVLLNPRTGIALLRTETHDAMPQRASAGRTGPTRAEIAARWLAASPVHRGSPYREEPSAAAPHRAGSPHPEFVRDALEMANYFRYLTGLPDDLVTDRRLNELAQHGAVLLAAGGEFAHEPAKPPNMDDGFYRRGVEATASSNLSLYRVRSHGGLRQRIGDVRPGDELSLANAVRRFMRDEDTSNLAAVGHRRWILHPPLQRVGFGYAHTLEQEDGANELSVYGVMHVFDTGRAENWSGSVVPWPSEGNVPMELFHAGDPWSVSLNPERFAQPNVSEVSVTLTRERDRRVWTLDEADSVVSEEGEFFTVSVDGYGWPYCIIFRPSGIDGFRPGDRYDVRIEGLQDRDGRPVELRYQVEFFRLDDYVPPQWSASVAE